MTAIIPALRLAAYGATSDLDSGEELMRRITGFATLWMLAPCFGAVLMFRAPGVEAACGSRWFPDLQCERSGRFEGFRKPIVAPFLFEDPFIVTGLYPYYMYHEYPDRSALQGGELNAVAAQIRVALTDRLGFIATKDGYGWNHPDNPLLENDTGWLNLAGGFKYAFVENREQGYIVSGILRFEAPSGAHDVFQGYGDGMVLPSVAGAFRYGSAHFIGDFGAQVPFDTDEQSTSLFYHLYGDYRVGRFLQPFAQLSGITWIDGGDGDFPVRLKNGVELPLDTVQKVLGTGHFEGADLANLGSKGVAGQDLWTWALGTHVRLIEHVTLSVAYERPFSHQKGIFKQRVTTAVALEF